MGDEATGQRDGSAREKVDGIDAAGVGAWFAANVPGARVPLSYERIAGGHSNLTYRVADAAGSEWALRRPPMGKTLSSAHDMAREHRVVAALGKTDVPVAPTVGLCEDESVNGAPFYVMDFVRGPVLRGVAEAEASFPDEGDRHEIGMRVADTLAAIHAVDPDAVGLGDLGRKEDYVARQLRRWYGQWEKSKTRELASIDRVHDRLAARIPAQEGASIVHGDYRLDNMILADSGEVAAVVDWELCTLGDPLADVGTLIAYWPERGGESIALGLPANLAPGFPTREELAARYAEASGRDLADLDFYIALGYWKLAIILEGVYARYAAGGYGQAGTDDSGFEAFARLVERLAETAAEIGSRG
ncbi:MAG TPA: phosphotransferase family protein [Solirubrobacterales bacterium]|jgi:aminoglycoside phosphotransferase (APT) family kinase protein|nr:phosphotransferase family protein [Solirubrobacterales bacterium]